MSLLRVYYDFITSLLRLVVTALLAKLIFYNK
jgi:hypothetical protein